MEKIGEILRNTRIEKGLSYQEIETDTRIRCRYLEALEDENWDILPEDVYTKGFLSSYARYLGLNPHKMLDMYKQNVALPPDPQPSVQKIELPGRPRWKMGLVVGIVAIIILVFSQYLYRSIFTPAPSLTVNNPAPPTTQGSDDPAATQPAVNPTPADDPAEAEVESLALRIKTVQGACWIRVKNNDQTVYEGTLAKGEERIFPDLENVVFTLGNAGSVQVFLNDQDLGPLGSLKQVVTKRYVLEDNAIKDISS